MTTDLRDTSSAMPHGPPRRRRARPVADAPIDALVLRAEDLAKGWLLALLEQAPLHDAHTILVADLSRDGPRVCDAAVRALGNDADLRRIEPGGALERWSVRRVHSPVPGVWQRHRRRSTRSTV